MSKTEQKFEWRTNVNDWNLRETGQLGSGMSAEIKHYVSASGQWKFKIRVYDGWTTIRRAERTGGSFAKWQAFAEKIMREEQ